MNYSIRTATAVCKRILKSAEAMHRDVLKYAFPDKNGNQCFCDGFRAYRLAEPLPDMPTIPQDLQPINLDYIFSALQPESMEEMPAPSLDAVKTFVKAQRGLHKPAPFDLGEKYPMVNARFLQDLLQLFPGARWFVNADPYRRMISPLYVTGPNGSGCLLPVRSDAKPHTPPMAPTGKQEPPAPAPVPQQQPREMPAASADPAPYKYLIYARLPGDKQYFLADPGRGSYKLQKLFAPRFKESDYERITNALDLCAAENPGSAFQLRSMDGKRVVYQAVPTFTPEAFAHSFAA